jgi:hypothetical protein
MGLDGHTKPSITSTNGNGTISNGKQESIVMRIPKLPFLSNKVIIISDYYISFQILTLFSSITESILSIMFF